MVETSYDVGQLCPECGRPILHPGGVPNHGNQHSACTRAPWSRQSLLRRVESLDERLDKLENMSHVHAEAYPVPDEEGSGPGD